MNRESFWVQTGLKHLHLPSVLGQPVQQLNQVLPFLWPFFGIWRWWQWWIRFQRAFFRSFAYSNGLQSHIRVNKMRKIQLSFVTTHLKCSFIISQTSFFFTFISSKPNSRTVLLRIPYLCRELPPRPPPHTTETLPHRRRVTLTRFHLCIVDTLQSRARERLAHWRVENLGAVNNVHEGVGIWFKLKEIVLNWFQRWEIAWCCCCGGHVLEGDVFVYFGYFGWRILWCVFIPLGFGVVVVVFCIFLCFESLNNVILISFFNVVFMWDVS